MQKGLVLVLMSIHLIVGNAILYFSELGALLTSLIGGSQTTVEQILLHALCSSIAVSSILLITRLIQARPKGTFVILTALSLAGSVAVPFLSTFILFVGQAIILREPGLLTPALFMAIAVTTFSIQYWLPFALANFAFFLTLDVILRRKRASLRPSA